jgi:Cyclic nucleotide-binding domain
MADSGIAAGSMNLRSQFLDGLISAHRKTVPAAATQRRLVARSVVTNQGQPVHHLFLLTKGFARFFFVTEDGRKLLFQWIGSGDVFGGELFYRGILRISTKLLVAKQEIANQLAHPVPSVLSDLRF